MKKGKILLSLVLMLILVAPAGFMASGDSETEDQAVPDQDETEGGLIGKSDNVNVERLESEDMDDILGDFDYRKESKSITGSNDVYIPEGQLSKPVDLKESPFTEGIKDEKFGSMDLDNSLSGEFQSTGLLDNLELHRGYPMDIVTRATDDDPTNDDSVNGSSIVTPQETIDGTLEYAQAGSDGIDWYQLELTDNDPSPQGLIHNVSFTLDSYTGEDLEEFHINSDGDDIVNTYGDLITLYVIYYDPFLGTTFIGGKEFYFDDQDDTDGWIWDGDHPEYPDNYTYHFETPIKSEGKEDPDGYANGLTESGFYYMGLTFSWYRSQSAPATRPGFTTNYRFTIDTSSMEQADRASSDWKNATAPYTENTYRLDSRFNKVDWYKIEGNNPDLLWNVTLNFNVTQAVWGINSQYIYDPWTYVYYLYNHEGEDGEWDTDDDGLRGWVWHFDAFGISFSENNPAISPGINSQFVPQYPFDFTPSFHMRNIDSPKREIYLGLMEEPQEYSWDSSSGQITNIYYPSYSCWTELNFQVHIGEYTPNNQPEISGVKIKTENPKDRELFPAGGGYYETNFIIEVTYLDIDNDRPTEVLLTLDPDTPYERTIDVTDPDEGGGPKDAFDKDYTDADPTPGKVYRFKILGEDLTDTPDPHQIKVNATDFKKTGNIRLPKISDQFYLNDTLRVWDDEPVIANPNFEPLPPLYEDDPTTELTLENVNGDGLFEDPEGEFTGFDVWNKTSEDWDSTYDSDIFHLEIDLNDLNTWVAFITPKFNEHGEETVKFRGKDEHSMINASARIAINPVNDPPMVDHILIGSSEVDVNNEDPLRPVVNLMDRDDVREDEEFSFTIVAEDTDKEEDWGELEYSYVSTQSDQWDGTIDITWDTGDVTFTPTNDDVKGKEKMVFSIDDGGTDGDIRLEVRLDVKNTNDPPQITMLQMPGSSTTNFDQFDRISINVIANDEDSLAIGNQETLTYSVNMDQSIDGKDAIIDQLSADAGIQKGGNWDMEETTGAFWFQIDDQNIWKTADGMVDEVEVNLVFQVKDAAGDIATKNMILTLKDVNEEPPKPGEIEYEIQDEDPETNGAQGLTVDFSVTEVEDPDGDELTYHWNFGDGTTATGTEVSHTFPSEGRQEVRVYVSDGEYDTEESFVRFDLEDVEEENGGTEPTNGGGTTPVEEDGNDNTMLYIIIGVGVLILLIVLVVLLFFMMRKKPQPAQQQYAGYDQQALGGYEAQGLPPGQEQQLPAAQQQGLPEGEPTENLPPAGGEMPQQDMPQEQEPQAQPETGEMGAQQEAPEAQSEMEQPEGEGGMTCPSCGSPVDSSWFLCPNCKAPLQ